ncbi:MAG: HU family DNA-binding protein [Holophaga sp.]|nr:HU family DNA-binding protein [Holophaga sp.]
MIKEDLAKKIAPEFNLSLNAAARLVQILLDEIVNALISGSRIELRRFGVFGIIKQKARVITLPSGKKVRRHAQKMVTFNPSPAVKKKLNPSMKKPQKRS